MDEVVTRLQTLTMLTDVSEILEFVQTIDSVDDLKEYFFNFFGSGPDVVKFVDDFLAYRDTGVMPGGSGGGGDSKALHAITDSASKTVISTYAVASKPKNNRVVPNRRATSSIVLEQKQKPETAPQQDDDDPSLTAALAESLLPSSKPPPTPPKPTPTPLTIGKPTIICGCYGTLHKALANCLVCGRISCEKEGYSFCGFCGYLISLETTSSTDAKSANYKKLTMAQMHTNRLLMFDRENARRTTVFDDQSDYFRSSRDTWNDDEEREESRGKDEKARGELHDRKAVMLDLSKIL